MLPTSRSLQRWMLLAPAALITCAVLAKPAAAAQDMTIDPAMRVALQDCDNPTPVRAPGGAIYSNVSDCAAGGGRKISTGWVELGPAVRFVPSGLTAYGNGRRGPKLSGVLVEGDTLYLLERNLTRSGGMRVGWSPSVDQPSVTWTATLPFGYGSFAQGSPDGYEYVYLRDSRSAYGRADRVDLARVPKGRVADLSAWQVFAGTPAAPAWLPWASRASRKPVLADRGRVFRPQVSHLGTCWVMAVTMPAAKGGSGLAVYTSANPFGPWNRRYYAVGEDDGESAQLSPLFPGQVLMARGDRFEWHPYRMPGGC